MYDSTFFDQVTPGSLRSAQAVVPILTTAFSPSTVVDVGCGEGAWSSVFAQHGCEVTGIDHGIEVSRLLIPQDQFVDADLTSRDIGTSRLRPSYDLALCLEVGEHLPPGDAAWLVEVLTTMSGVVVFSAAIPGQGGAGHCNERWPQYWVKLFEDRGYVVSGALRWRLWHMVPDPVECWYAQNMLACVHSHELTQRWDELEGLFNGHAFDPVPVVHPFLWESRQ